MTNRFIKFAAAVAPAALLLAVGATPANAKVLLMGDGGWEVSFDGSVNGFAVWTGNQPPVTNTIVNGVTETHSGGAIDTGADTRDSFRVRTGLLPAVWGMNVKAPTTGGLDMAARIGIYPNISNNTKNSFGSSSESQLDLREIFFTVDGSFGQALVGKTLSQFLGKNILTDQTLFGIGATGGNHGAGTTLGRIGFGYPYPQFNARIQYTTPDMSGFKVSVGAYDPSVINSNQALGLTADRTTTPRFEGEASWAGSLAGTTDLAWISGMDQSSTFSSASPGTLGGSSVNVWGFAGGLQVGIPVGPGTLELMGSGYVGSGIGTTLQLDTDSLDGWGTPRDNDGFIGQVGYAFGQGTKLQASYGESTADETSSESICRTAPTTAGAIDNGISCAAAEGTARANLERQDLWDVMLSHDINPNLKLVAEYGRQSEEWFDGKSLDGNVFGVGAFFFL
ncbi:MAG: porin [Alphaproteobacteria bacterium]